MLPPLISNGSCGECQNQSRPVFWTTDLGLLERTDEAGVVCPYDSVHIDMHLQAA
jgi:hypothetical protein